jgi:hypothetical protein
MCGGLFKAVRIRMEFKSRHLILVLYVLAVLLAISDAGVCSGRGEPPSV